MGIAKRNKKKLKKGGKFQQKTKARLNQSTGFTQKHMIYLLALLFIAVFLVYSPLPGNEYISFDDRIYVTENPYIKNFNGSSIKQLFTEFYQSQYSPVAMSIVGLQFKISEAAPFNKTISIVWHLLASILVFLVLKNLFKQPLLIILPTLLFALHPINVESLAWTAASFKIGPYALFFLLSLLFYIWYLDKKKTSYLVYSLVLFVLSCLSKEQAISLSITLLAIDYIKGRKLLSRKVWLEKIPFIIISLIFGILTIKASESAIATNQVVSYGLLDRLVITNYSIYAYLGKLLVPVNLSFFYFYPPEGSIPPIYYASILLTLGVLVGLYFAWKRNANIVLFGIAFFLINIALTLLMQILGNRDNMMADRYLYIASIGFFLLISQLMAYLTNRSSFTRKMIYGTLIIYLLFLSVSVFARSKLWKDSVTIFNDVIEKQSLKTGKQKPALALAYNEIGVAKKQEGNYKAALTHYNKGIKINPNYNRLYTNRGNVFFETGDFNRAIENYNKSIELNKEMNPKAYSARCAAYGSMGKFDLALEDINISIEQDPTDPSAYKNRAAIYTHTKVLDKALSDATKYLELAGTNPSAYHLRGEIHRESGNFGKSLEDLNKAVQLAPSNGLYFYSRAMTQEKLGRIDAAKRDATKARNLGYKVPDSFMRRLN